LMKIISNQFNTADSNIIDDLFIVIYDNVILPIDAWDNGIQQYNPELISQCNYYSDWNMSSTVAKLNYSDINNYNKQMERFIRASNLILEHLLIFIEHHYTKIAEYNQDYAIITEFMEKRPHENIVVIEKDCNNWLQCLKDYESNNRLGETIKFVIYKNDNQWRIKTITTIGFNRRKSLLSYDELIDRVSNKDDLIFVHKAKFIASSKNLNCAMEVAKLSL